MRSITAAFVLLLILAACSNAEPSDTTGATPTNPSTTSSTTSTTTAESTTTTGPTDPVETAWTELAAEKHVANYLAALAAGAFEQAAWAAENNGLVIDGQTSSETVAEAMARMCADGACSGPYEVEADGPGIVDPDTAQASSIVVVTHTESGESVAIEVATFEGQIYIGQLPPLVPGERGRSLVEELFGSNMPRRVVVERFHAFEIWESSQPTWVTNWWAESTYQVEGGLIALFDGVVTLDDPTLAFEADCLPRLVTRASELLVLEQCDTSDWRMYEAYTGDPRELPVDMTPREDGEFPWFTERAGTVVSGVGDAEGNMVSLSDPGGVDLLGDDYASAVVLSTDGTKVAYVDHADPAAVSHFWSPVVVVKDVTTGDEIGRWTMPNPVLRLEFGETWVVASEIDQAAIGTEHLDQIALNAIDLTTGEVTRVETPTQLFLPG